MRHNKQTRPYYQWRLTGFSPARSATAAQTRRTYVRGRGCGEICGFWAVFNTQQSCGLNTAGGFMPQETCAIERTKGAGGFMGPAISAPSLSGTVYFAQTHPIPAGYTTRCGPRLAVQRRLAPILAGVPGCPCLEVSVEMRPAHAAQASRSRAPSRLRPFVKRLHPTLAHPIHRARAIGQSAARTAL